MNDHGWTLDAWIDHSRELRQMDQQQIMNLAAERAANEQRYYQGHSQLESRITAIESRADGAGATKTQLIALATAIAVVVAGVVAVITLSLH